MLDKLKNVNVEEIKKIDCVVFDKIADPNTTQENCVHEATITLADTEFTVSADMNDQAGRIELTKAIREIVHSGKGKIPFCQKQLTKKTGKEASKQSSKKVGIGIGIGATTAAVAFAASACGNSQEDKEVAQNNVMVVEDYRKEEEAKVNKIVKADMVGKNWDYYIENATDNVQKQAWTQVGEFLLEFNNSQDWMARTSNNGENAIFGLTPEEAMALHVRMNEYTDEELITIYNSMNINADEIMNLSNDALERMNLYYRISKVPSGIAILFNDEHDQEVIRAFEVQHIKMMNANGTEKEELMQEEKQMYQDYFNSDIEGKETKARAASTSYILRTMLPASQGIADLNDYKDTIILYSVNNQKQVEVKADLFDEVFMARYITGFENFDEEHYIKQLGYNADNYYLGIDGEKLSIADISCGEQEQKFRDADSFRVELETSAQVIADNRNAIKEALVLAVDENGQFDEKELDKIIDRALADGPQQTIDQLTEFSYDPELIANMLTEKLKEKNKMPAYANTFFELYTEMVLAQENIKLGSNVTSSKTTTITKTTSSALSAKEMLMGFGLSSEVAEAKIVEAEEKAAAAVGAERDTAETHQKHEEQAKKEEYDLQNIYNETYNAYANGYSGEFKSEWANSSDANVRNTYNMAKQDGIDHYSKIKSAEESNSNNNESTELNIPSDHVQDGSITDDPSGSEGTIQDVINESNNEDTNQENKDETQTPTEPESQPESQPEHQPEPQPEPQPEETTNYAPIVDDSIPAGGGEIEYYDSEDIINQVEFENTTSEEDLVAAIMYNSMYDLSALTVMDDAYADESQYVKRI
ncbi:MAG: hypothetical protein PUB18_03035 [bacterium]|nr:hypothetical protein [bacterium]